MPPVVNPKPRNRWLLAAGTLATAVTIAAAVLIVAWSDSWHGSDSDPSSSSVRDQAVPLVRHQAPAPAIANTLSVTSDGPAGWSPEPPLGLAYMPGEDRVRGLIPIYRHRCIDGCGEDLVYAFSPRSTRGSKWEPEGEAFRCFDPENPPDDMDLLAVRKLTNNHTNARTWAVRGTDYYDYALSHGFSEPERDPLCYIVPQTRAE